MERLWYREVLFNGFGANGFKLGTVLTGGWFWVRVDGCSLLYRGGTIGEIDFNNILAVYGLAATEVEVPGYINYWGGDRYVYNVRRADGCGRSDWSLKAAVVVELDPFNKLVEGRCNSVFEIFARQVDGFRVELTWSYFSWQQGAAVSCFRVYGDNGTGQIDYEQAISEVSYDGRRFYNYCTDGLGDGRYQFEVKAVNSDMVENDGFARAEVQVRTEKPVCLEIVGVDQL